MRKTLLILCATAMFSALGAGTAVASVRSTDPKTHIHVEPAVNPALPSKRDGCGGVTALRDGAQRIPIRVSTVAGQVFEVVNVCLDGMGPYPFEIDTGSALSGIDTRLATRLHMADIGSPFSSQGIGCSGTAQLVSSPAWSLAGVGLAPQPLIASIQPGLGEAGEPVGLLGSDVLSRFGAVRLDFKAQTLTVDGDEGPSTEAAGATVHGPIGPPPPDVLTHGQHGTTVPATVTFSPGQLWIAVSLRFANGPALHFVVDTGSSQSEVDSRVAADAHLKPTDLAQRQQAVCGVATAALVHSGHWSLPGLALHPQLIDSQSFGAISAGGVVGTLGSDQLQRYGWVIFDYSGGRLVLG